MYIIQGKIRKVSNQCTYKGIDRILNLPNDVKLYFFDFMVQKTTRRAPKREQKYT